LGDPAIREVVEDDAAEVGVSPGAFDDLAFEADEPTLSIALGGEGVRRRPVAR
jgi:hypothetical protein